MKSRAVYTSNGRGVRGSRITRNVWYGLAPAVLAGSFSLHLFRFLFVCLILSLCIARKKGKLLSEIFGQEHTLEALYHAGGASEAEEHSGGGARQGEEAHAHACKYFQGCERERGDSVAKPRRYLRRVEDEASGVYHVEVEVEARGTTGSAAEHDKRGLSHRADITRGAGGATQVTDGSI